MEFNADGSLKLSAADDKKINQDNYNMKTARCVRISKAATKTTAPKSCTISIDTSPLVEDGFVERMFGFFSKRVDSSVKLIKLSSSEYQVTIGNQFSRCRDCMLLSSMFREHMGGIVIEKKGSCTFKFGASY